MVLQPFCDGFLPRQVCAHWELGGRELQLSTEEAFGLACLLGELLPAARTNFCHPLFWLEKTPKNMTYAGQNMLTLTFFDNFFQK